MVKGIYHSAAGMLARQRQLEVTANNLANAATVGFKQQTLCFKETLNSSLAEARPNASEIMVDAEGGVQQTLRQGTLSATGNPLHAAIIGEGFFAVETPAGVAYTRDGRFQLNAEGELVTLSGHRVLTAGGSVILPQGDLHIGSDGSLVMRDAAAGRDQILDRLQIVSFADPRRLNHAEGGLYLTPQEAIELPQVRLQVGYVEDSTVNVISEMVKMIETNQYYDASARAIQTQDATLAKAVNEVGKV